MKKRQLENLIDELASASTDAYSASLPLMASAELGDNKRYELARAHLFVCLDDLEQRPETMPKWMQNNSFKAWMWGRILSAAATIDDVNTAIEAQGRLQSLLDENKVPDARLAFSTWAWGYRAAYDQKEYATSKQSMMDGALALNAKDNNSAEPGSLPDALWAWVMNLYAAARAGDQGTYQSIKEHIKSIAQAPSVPQALDKGLLRSAQSNDYPAWAMAKVRCAARVAGDNDLYREIENPLIMSIEGAQKANAYAEYVLSVLGNRWAVLMQKK